MSDDGDAGDCCNDDGVDDIYENDEYQYKYRYIGCIEPKSKYIIVADAKSSVEGATHLKKFNWKKGDTGDSGSDYHVFGPIRNKEGWYCFLKYQDAEENNITMLDVILINSKLYDALPEQTDFDKLEDLNWEGDGNVCISNNNLAAFDCGYFNNPTKFNIPDQIKTMPNPWFEYISRTLMKAADSIIADKQGAALFIDNGDYEIYAIKDTVSKEILGLDIELGVPDDVSELFDSDSKDVLNDKNVKIC